MEEARAVLARLERIETLERDAAPAAAVLEELRSLLVEAELWARVEKASDSATADALDGLRTALDRG